NSQTQVIHAGDDQRLFSSVFVAGAWMMPRLPVNVPRCGVAMMSPVGVTRFCRGMVASARHCEERSDEAVQITPADASLDCFASLAMTATVTPPRRAMVGDRRARYPRGRRSTYPAKLP